MTILELLEKHKTYLPIYSLAVYNFKNSLRYKNSSEDSNEKKLVNFLEEFINSIEFEDLETFSRLEKEVKNKINTLL